MLVLLKELHMSLLPGELIVFQLTYLNLLFVQQLQQLIICLFSVFMADAFRKSAFFITLLFLLNVINSLAVLL